MMSSENEDNKRSLLEPASPEEFPDPINYDIVRFLFTVFALILIVVTKLLTVHGSIGEVDPSWVSVVRCPRVHEWT